MWYKFNLLFHANIWRDKSNITHIIIVMAAELITDANHNFVMKMWFKYEKYAKYTETNK